MISAKDQFSARNLISQVANFFREIQYTYVATNWFPLGAPQLEEPPHLPHSLHPWAWGVGFVPPTATIRLGQFLLLLVFINKGIATMNGWTSQFSILLYPFTLGKISCSKYPRKLPLTFIPMPLVLKQAGKHVRPFENWEIVVWALFCCFGLVCFWGVLLVLFRYKSEVLILSMVPG